MNKIELIEKINSLPIEKRIYIIDKLNSISMDENQVFDSNDDFFRELDTLSGNENSSSELEHE